MQQHNHQKERITKMATVKCEQGFKPYTITIDTLGEHKSLLHLVKERNDLYTREYAMVCRGNRYGMTHPTQSAYKYTELTWEEVALLRNIDGKLPTFK